MAVATILAASSAAIPATASAAATCAAGNYAVTPLQSGVFYIDVQTSYLGSYVGYSVTNQTGASQADLWVRLENFAGGTITPASGAATTSASALSTLASGAKKSSYAYLKAPVDTLTAQTHDVVVYRGRPGAGGVEVCRQPETITSVQDVIKAAANKVTSATGPSSATLGGTFTLSVAGQSGTIGAGIASDPGIVRFSPAVASDWPSSAFRLVGVSHQLPLGSMPVNDLLSRSNMSGASRDYSIDYTFKVVGPTSAATPIVPVQNIASGTQVKHTDPGSFSSLSPIPVVTSNAVVAVTAGGTAPYVSGASVPLSAKLTNSGSASVTVDEFTLTLPGTWSAVAGSWNVDGGSVSDAYTDGSGVLHLVGPFTIPANSSSTVSFSALAGTAGSTGNFTSIAALPGGQIDSTSSPSDDVPASTSLVVIAPPTAVADSYAPVSGISRDLDVLANDTVSGTPTLTIVSGPANGTASIVDGKIRYQSSAGYVGADSIVYRVTTAGGTDTATVSLNVTAAPAAPAPGNEATTGVGTAQQKVDLTVPAGDTVRLVSNGALVTKLVTSEGTYTLDTTTGQLTFDPVLGFSGTATPVTYRITDGLGQTGNATYTPAVTKPAAPSAANLTSTGVAPSTQTVTIAVPSGGSVTLLDASSNPTTSVTHAGEGTFVLDPATGEVTFTPEVGFSGAAAAVTYRVTDAYGSTGTATDTPTVTKPAAPAAPAGTSTGVGTATQTKTFSIPSGGSVHLVDPGTGASTDTLVVAGEGTYVLDPATGTVTFTPVLGFSGTASAVEYRIPDAYGQPTKGTYTPSVTKPAGPTAATETSTGVGTTPQTGALVAPPGGSVHLVDPATGASVDQVTVPGEGTYVLDPATGKVTFTPVLGFSGQGGGVDYRLIDAYGQSTRGTYTPSVTPSANAAALGAQPVAAAAPAQAPEPARKRCVSRRKMIMHFLVDRQRLNRVIVTVNGKRTSVLAGTSRTATVDMRGRSASKVRVVITGITPSGRKLRAVRTYIPCTARRVGKPLPTLRLR